MEETAAASASAPSSIARLIELIAAKPYGLMNLLDEEVRMPQGSDQKYLAKIVERQKTSKAFGAPGDAPSLPHVDRVRIQEAGAIVVACAAAIIILWGAVGQYVLAPFIRRRQKRLRAVDAARPLIGEAFQR